MIPKQLEPIPGTQFKLFRSMDESVGNLPTLAYPEGCVLSRWELSLEEREAIAQGQAIDLWIWTFGYPLQPVSLRVEGLRYEGDLEFDFD